MAAGTALLPLTVIMFLFSARVGRAGRAHRATAADDHRARWCRACGLLLLLRVGPDASWFTDVLPAMIVFGAGMTLTVSPLTATVLDAAPDRFAGSASGVNNAVARAAGLLAVAIIPGIAGIEGDSYNDPVALNAGFRTSVLISAGLVVAAAGRVVRLHPTPTRRPRARAGARRGLLPLRGQRTHAVPGRPVNPRARAAPFRMKPRVLVAADPSRPSGVPAGTEAVVVGGGIAGVSAAVVLAERGVAVTLLEAAPTLGGRLGAWPHTLPDGTPQVVEHGFHAFFRHYYTWRDILRRIDPGLAFLRPIGGYPVISRSWPPEDLTGLPGAPPLNLIALFARSPSLGLRDLLGSDQALAGQLFAYDAAATTAAFDDVPAARFLTELGMSDRAQAMLFEAFARSFFARPAALSAAELIAMFHYYFLGNPEGIGFDAPDTDYLTCIWAPLRAYLERRGVQVRTGTPVRALHAAARWRVETDEEALDTRHVVLALDPGALRTVVGASSVPEELARQAAACAVAPPFAVARLWLDRDVDPARPVFNAVSREPTLDSVTVYSRLERPSAEWAARTGGSVVELHSYACTAPDGATATERMRAELRALWPETGDARVVHSQVRFEATAPTFPPGTAGTRPRVTGAAPGVRIAGDHVDPPYLCGLMERAALTGVLAANDVLGEVGARPEPVRGVPQRGLLAGWRVS